MNDTITMEYRGRRTRRADGHARRQAILEAALRIIVRDGIRAVRHRAVAAEAQVPLAATTYYFKDLRDLISDALTLHAEQSLGKTPQLGHAQLSQILAAHKDAGARGQALTQQVMAHLRAQVTARDARVIEHAFRHEALRNEKLAADVQVPEQAQVQQLAAFFSSAGSPDPAADAQVLFASLLYWEYQLTLVTPTAEKWQQAEKALSRLIASVLSAR